MLARTRSGAATLDRSSHISCRSNRHTNAEVHWIARVLAHCESCSLAAMNGDTDSGW